MDEAAKIGSEQSKSPWKKNMPNKRDTTWYSYGPLPVISTYNSIYRLYNPIYNQL